jgi:large conductance mechanosensitive channel
MYIQLKGPPQETLADAKKVGATIAYGNFFTLTINFLIVAWVLFLVVKAMNQIKRQPPQPDKIPRQEQLLTEIRDLLRGRA